MDSFIFIQVFKMLNNKESLDQIIVATPGLSSDAMALSRLPLHLELVHKDFFLEVRIPITQ